MKKLILLVFLLTPGLSFAQDVESLLRERVETKETPGIIVGVYENGKIQYYSQGVGNKDTGSKVDSNTLFEIGSITKTFTNIALACQLEEGKALLSDHIEKFLPSNVSSPGRDGKTISLLDLATARSGLPRLPGNMQPSDAQNPYIDYTEEMMFSFLTDYVLPRDPGTQYEYSNLGMGLLGVIVSKIESKPYRQVVTERILLPLKMNSTFLSTPDRNDKNRAQGYSGSQPAKFWTWTDQSSIQGAGGLISNAQDMMKYLIANLEGKDGALGKAMSTTHIARNDAGRPDMKIGLGWHIKNNIVWHNGGTGGFRTFAAFDPQKKKAVVVLTNSNIGADDLGFNLMDPSAPLKKIRRPVAVDPKLLASYVGTYEFHPHLKMEVSLSKDQLRIHVTDEPQVDIYGENETKFFQKSGTDMYEFVKNESGEVVSMTRHQGEITEHGKKVK